MPGWLYHTFSTSVVENIADYLAVKQVADAVGTIDFGPGMSANSLAKETTEFLCLSSSPQSRKSEQMNSFYGGVLKDMLTGFDEEEDGKNADTSFETIQELMSG